MIGGRSFEVGLQPHRSETFKLSSAPFPFVVAPVPSLNQVQGKLLSAIMISAFGEAESPKPAPR